MCFQRDCQSTLFCTMLGRLGRSLSQLEQIEGFMITIADSKLPTCLQGARQDPKKTKPGSATLTRKNGQHHSWPKCFPCRFWQFPLALLCAPFSQRPNFIVVQNRTSQESGPSPTAQLPSPPPLERPKGPGFTRVSHEKRACSLQLPCACGDHLLQYKPQP